MVAEPLMTGCDVATKASPAPTWTPSLVVVPLA